MIKPSFESPSNIYVEFDNRAVQTMDGPGGQPMKITSRSLIGLLQQDVRKNGSIEISATIDRILGDMSFTETMRSLYDSDEPDYEEASPMHRDAFTPIMNLPIKIALDANGRATSVSGGQPIRDKLKALGDANFVAKSLAETEFADSQIKSLFGETAAILYPNREVKPGETWQIRQNDEFPQVGKVIVNYECKLDGIDKAGGGETARISYKGGIEKDDSEKPAKDQRLGKIDATFTGTAKFDTALGRFTEITRKTKAKFEIPPWFSKDAAAPLMKIEGEFDLKYTILPVADRLRQKAANQKRIAEAKAKEEAEQAAAMAGPVDPVTPENPPVAWLQWGGPDRNFSSRATGLANRWPKDGPPKLWERTLGDGYSAIVADGDAIYTMYSARDKADAYKGDDVVVALDAKTGKTIWEYKYPAPWPKTFNMEFGPGPYSTPIIVGDNLFTIGCTAILNCIEKKTGKVVWTRDLHKDHKAELLERGYGSSPLAHKGNIVLTVSKEKGKAIMAFSQKDGSDAWSGGEFDPGYASLIAIDVDGVEQLVAFSGKAVIGFDPVERKQTWSIDHPTQWGANITTPLWYAADKHLFISSAYGMGSRGVKLEKAGSQVAAKEVWFNPKMKIQHADAVRVGDWVYGSSGDFGPAFLACVNAKTGEFGWRKRGIAKATLIHADGKLIILDEDGSLFLVKADPEKYRLLAKAPEVLTKHAWTAPTLVGRTLYLRDREKIMALNLGETSGAE